jgi:hypothetical protein
VLTAAELFELTGYRSPAWQAKWLRSHGWKFEQGRDGPKVLRAYRDMRMGMVDVTQDKPWKPDFSVLGKLCR